MRRQAIFATVACALISIAGCSGSSQGSSSSSSSSSTSTESSPSPTTAPMHTALPSTAKTPVTFNFNDVAVATGGSNTLRLGFDIANKSSDPQLCDPSEFYVQLDDGTVIAADGSADNTCDPNTVDPSGSGKGVMYFDLPHTYTGGVTMFMVVDDAIVGQSNTTVK